MHQILIGGVWVDARADSVRDIVNPATLKPLGAVPECDPQDIARAVSAARQALAGWRDLPGQERARLLVEIGARIRARRRELAALLSCESGKPLCEAADCVDAAAQVFERCAHGAVAPVEEAACVVAAILPFNFPLLLMAAHVVPAVVAGNTLVCKPAPRNPLASLMLARVFEALPAGVVNMVTGGAGTGFALVSHPGVGRVVFTGSAETAARIQSAAAGKRLDLEVGSVDAFIVCKDANLDLAVPAIAWARLMSGGQGCGLGGHVYVERSIAAEFIDRMHPCMGFLDVDDPAKAPTDLGPVISVEAAQRLEDQVGRSLREGAKLILGGRRFRPSGLAGHFFQPTILANVPARGVPTREHILGPVMTVTPVREPADALQLTDSGAGYGASIFTADPHGAMALIDPMRTGTFRINDPSGGELAGPYLGMRHGGVRRALGAAARVQVAALLQAKPWWFPYLKRKVEV